MKTVQDLVVGALELCGAIAAGETLSAADGQLGLRVFNDMMDSWSAENLVLYALKREVFELIPGKAQYKIGELAGADFLTPRPMILNWAAVGDLNKNPIYEIPEPTDEDPNPEPILIGYDLSVGLEFPVEIIDEQRWVKINQKSMLSGRASYVFLEGGAQNAVLNFWPIPITTLGLVLYSKNILSQAENLSTELDMPPGYSLAIEYNLAVDLASRFGKDLSPQVTLRADVLKGNIKVKNSQTPRLTSDVKRGKSFDIRLGE